MNIMLQQAKLGSLQEFLLWGLLFGRLFIGRCDGFRLDVKERCSLDIILFIITTSLYFIHVGITFLMITRLLHGITLGIASTATKQFVAQIIPITRKGEGIGYYSMSTTLATAIGPFVGLYMSQHTSSQMIFSLCLALGIFSLITAIFVESTSYWKKPIKTTEIKGFNLSQFIEPKAVSNCTVLL